MSVPQNDRVNVLERQIQELQRQLYQTRNRMGTELEKRTRAVGKRLEAKYAQNYKEAFSKALNDLKNADSTELRKQQEECKKLSAKIEQLEKEIANAKKQLYAKAENDTRHKKEAENTMRELLANIKSAASRPVEIFFPNKLKIYRDSAAEGERLIKRNLFTEAFAVLSSALLGTKRLENDCEQQERLFGYYFECYRNSVEQFKNIIQSDVMHNIKYKNQNIRLSDDDLAYWSDGTVTELLNEFEKHEQFIADVEKNGVRAAAKINQNDPVGCIREKTESLELFGECMKTAVGYAFSSFKCYDDFASAYQTVCGIMHSQGFLYDGCRFGEKNSALEIPSFYRKRLINERCIKDGAQPDYREIREMCFKRPVISGKNETVKLTFTPVRKEDTVNSLITMSLETYQAQNPLHDMFTEKLAEQNIFVSCGNDDIRQIMTLQEIKTIACTRMNTNTYDQY